MKTLYEVLGVDRQASITDIAQRYRHHLNQHVATSHQRAISKKDQRRLQQMREAYLLLTSPSRRRAYDLKIAQAERARNRWTTKAGIAACVAMLVAGAALIVRGYFQIQEKTSTASTHAVRGDGSGILSVLASTTPMKSSAKSGD